MLALFKTDILRYGIINIEVKIAETFNLLYNSLYSVSLKLYPKFYDLTQMFDLNSKIGNLVEDKVVMPPTTVCSIEKLKSNIYLVDNGQSLFLYIKPSVD